MCHSTSEGEDEEDAEGDYQDLFAAEDIRPATVKGGEGETKVDVSTSVLHTKRVVRDLDAGRVLTAAVEHGALHEVSGVHNLWVLAGTRLNPARHVN
jgi:broad specificity phosphatase PhoE